MHKTYMAINCKKKNRKYRILQIHPADFLHCLLFYHTTHINFITWHSGPSKRKVNFILSMFITILIQKYILYYSLPGHGILHVGHMLKTPSVVVERKKDMNFPCINDDLLY